MRVVIAGAGNVGLYIAQELHKNGHDVTLIEQEETVVERGRGSIDDGVRWVTADACEPSNLKRAGLKDADVCVAATGDDEDNLVVSLLAKQEFEVPRVVARVNHPENAWLFNSNWGVDVSVSTPHLLTALVEEAVSIGDLVQLLRLEQGQISLVEVTLAADCPVAGHTIGEIDFPRDATVVAVVRGGHVTVPRGDTPLRVGDEVLALAAPDSEAALRALLICDSGGEQAPLPTPP